MPAFASLAAMLANFCFLAEIGVRGIRRLPLRGERGLRTFVGVPGRVVRVGVDGGLLRERALRSRVRGE